MYSTDKEPVDEPREAPKMSVKKKQKKQAKKYDFCYQYPISQHRGYNNASGRVYMNCGKNQYKGAVKIDDTELPEPEYVNAEAIKREQKEMNKGLNPDSYTKSKQKEVSTGGLFVQDSGVFGTQDLITDTNNELANEMVPEKASGGAYDIDDTQSQLEVPAKFALSNKPKKVKVVEMYDDYPS